jgi:hypothetical protein
MVTLESKFKTGYQSGLYYDLGDAKADGSSRIEWEAR